MAGHLEHGPAERLRGGDAVPGREHRAAPGGERGQPGGRLRALALRPEGGPGDPGRDPVREDVPGVPERLPPHLQRAHAEQGHVPERGRAHRPLSRLDQLPLAGGDSDVRPGLGAGDRPEAGDVAGPGPERVVAEAEQRPGGPLPVSREDHRRDPVTVLHVLGPRRLRLRGDGRADDGRESRFPEVLQPPGGEGRYSAAPGVPHVFQPGRRSRGDGDRHGVGRAGGVPEALRPDGDKRGRFPDSLSAG